MESIQIKVKPLMNLLKRISLNGIIEDCVMVIRKKTAKIEAVDLSNNIIVIAGINILSKDQVDKLELGLGNGNIELLIKFLNTLNDTQIEMQYKNDRIIFKCKDAKRSLTYLLSDPELIATTINKDSPKENTKQKLIDLQEYKIKLTESFVKDFLSYISLSKMKENETSISYNHKNKTIIVTCGDNNTHLFKLTIDENIERLDKDSKSIDIKFNGDYLAKIFACLDFSNENITYLYIANEKPILVHDQNTLWAVMLYDSQDKSENDEE